MPRGTLALGLWLAPLGVLGCGARGGVAGDAGAEAPRVGLRAFDVVAAISSPRDAGIMGPQFPSTNRFTLGLDAPRLRLIVGANGTGSIVPVTTTDGKTFRTSAPFDVSTPPLGTCSSATRLTYETLELTVTGTRLAGHATGAVQISCGDCLFTQAFVGTFSGGADETPPTLVAGAREADFALMTSEPLPVGATARVVGSEGFGVALEPIYNGTDLPETERLVLGFSKPPVVLGVGGGYVVELGGLVDFAGLRAAAGSTIRIGGFAPPPLVAADGFESATGTTVGGAALVKKAGTVPELVPLAGAQSVYLGRPDALFATKLGAGPRLLVRLAVPAGATKVVYKARLVAHASQAGFGGSLWLGSVGKSFASDSAFGPVTLEGVTTFSDGSMLVLSEVQTHEVTLPSDVADEVVFEIAAYETGCGLSPPSSGLLIDDLRVE
jgi:hypothetical protein